MLSISSGTSGNVYPAANFVREVDPYRCVTVELNLEKSQVASHFKQGYYGKASDVVPRFVETLLLEYA